MAVPNYNTAEELNNIIYGNTEGLSETKKILMTNMSGVEGLPYQFMSTVDRRISDDIDMGRKYAEKIISRIPLLFLTPCKQVFMDDFGDQDKTTVTNWLLDKGSSADPSLLQGTGKYYSVEFDYYSYYQYLNIMLSSVAAFLGISDEKILVNGTSKKISDIDWSYEMGDTNGAFKTFFSSSENVIFYLDGMTQISESFSNNTTESSLASMINGFADQANEVKFLFGEKGGSVLGSMMDTGTEVLDSISSSLSNVVGTLGGGIVQSLMDSGVNTVLNGGKIIFPEIWSDSTYDRSYSLDIKLRSPDHDSLSIFLNVLKPYCKLLCMVLPKAIDDNPNGYKSPFLVKAFSKGLFNIDMGMITGMNVTKGAECCWNDDGLPTQIDISIEIKDLYSSLAMSGGRDKKHIVVSNTSYMDYLANMAGLNIAQMELGRKLKLYYYLQRNSLSTTPSRVFTKFDQNISNLIGGLYKLTS